MGKLLGEINRRESNRSCLLNEAFTDDAVVAGNERTRRTGEHIRLGSYMLLTGKHAVSKSNWVMRA